MELHEFHDIDSYIAGFPEDIRNLQTKLRAVIKKAAPEATEKISYSMPTFYQHGNLVHFAAYKNHVGFYPAASGIEAFKAELSAYKWSKGTIQFPLGKPLPVDLITRIVQFRLEENRQKVQKKKK
ncbi:MAG: hypothetical protein CVU14_08460 [Bacteroidetes bacterium HGW-Bacteroidetes-9]|nr:MAG: hypothetical protein CVU14_08460 [Bacteroidetes bacterium HGW-Bacteroidetes-9]